MFKKIILTLVLISCLSFSFAHIALADILSEDACREAYGQWDRNTGKCYIPEVTDVPGIITLINDIGNWIFAALIAVAVIFIVIAGFFYLTGGGNEENLRKGKNMLINALIGIAIALSARGLVAIIANLLTK